MSSLLQFDGEISEKGVRLEFVRYRLDIDKDIKECYLDPFVPCHICMKEHPQVGAAYRKPKGMLGQFVVFRYNGEDQVPDLSVPIDVEKWPKDTKMLNPIENSRLWHRNDTPRKWWARWIATSPFTLYAPFWVTGETFDGLPIMCAAIKAHDKETARRIVIHAHDKPIDSEKVYIDSRDGDWEPFSDRFPKRDWMEAYWSRRLYEHLPEGGRR